MLNRKQNKGFTFLELMVVVGILGILLAIAVPNYNRYRRQQFIRNTANDLAGYLKMASQEAKRGERFVGIRFKEESGNGGMYYEIIKDMNENSVIDDTDKNWNDDVGNDTGLIVEKHPVNDGVRVWGAGIADGKMLTFGRGGKVETAQTDLTLMPLPNSGYYSIMVSPQDNVQVAGETFEVKVYWDGKVETKKI